MRAHARVTPLVRRLAEQYAEGALRAPEVVGALRERYRTPCSLNNQLSRLKRYLQAEHPRARRQALAAKDDARSCKAEQRARALRRQQRWTRVPAEDARALIERTERVLRRSARLEELALHVLLASGRRTAEVLNGRSRFASVRGAPRHALFHGQLKVRDARAYVIPLLVPRALLERALQRLRALQRAKDPRFDAIDNRGVSSKYQSRLRVALREDAQLAQYAPTVHALRALYACMVLSAFDFGDMSPRAAVQRVLGHAQLRDADKYIRYDVPLARARLPFAGLAQERA